MARTGTSILNPDTPAVELSPAGLSRADVVAVGRDDARVALGEASRRAMAPSAEAVARLAASAEPAYGVSTGFGALASVAIPAERRAELQRALVRSHAAGMGPPIEREAVRAMLLLRARTLAIGCSGARPQVVDGMLALNALLTTASGATWVSIHHGGGVGIGRSIHAGMVCVADGSELAAEKLERVLTCDDLIETKRAAHGAGLAASQIGVGLRIAIVEVEPGNPRYPYKPPVALTVIVNPLVEPVGDELIALDEGCLSVPGLRGTVERWASVRVRYVDRDGHVRDELRRGLTAGTFQHEIDHLEGVLFLDRVRDPGSFATWEQWERHRRDAFLARAAELVERLGA